MADIPAMPENWGSMTDKEKASFLKGNSQPDIIAKKAPAKTVKDADEVRKAAAALVASEKAETAADPGNAFDAYDRAYEREAGKIAQEKDKKNGDKKGSWLSRIQTWLDNEAESFGNQPSKKSTLADVPATKLDYSVKATEGKKASAPAKPAGTVATQNETEKGANESAQYAVNAGAGTQKEAAKKAAETLRPSENLKADEELIKALQKASKNVDVEMISNIPKSLRMMYRNGDFTAGGKMQEYNAAKSELKELKAKYKQADDGGKSDLQKQIEAKKAEIDAITNTKEFRDGRKLYFHLMANDIGSKLINGYSILKGGGLVVESAKQKINKTRLEGALERHNQKAAETAKTSAELLFTDAKDQQDARLRINRWLTDASLRPYIQQLSLDDQKRLLDWEKRMGRDITAEDVANLAKFQLLGNENAGNSVKGTLGKMAGAVGL